MSRNSGRYTFCVASLRRLLAVVNGSPHIGGGTNRCTPSVLLSWFVTEKLNIESSASCLGRRTARSAIAAQGAGKQIT